MKPLGCRGIGVKLPPAGHLAALAQDLGGLVGIGCTEPGLETGIGAEDRRGGGCAHGHPLGPHCPMLIRAQWQFEPIMFPWAR